MKKIVDKYITLPKLVKQIKRLENEKEQLRKQLNMVTEELSYIYERKCRLENIESVKIKMEDLLTELKNISGYDILAIELYALEHFYDKDQKTTNERMNFLGNKLKITLSNNKSIYCCGANLFRDLDEIQADGKPLIQHCTEKYRGETPVSLVVDKNIENVICNFDSNFFLDNPSCVGVDVFDEDKLLQQAIFSCVEQEKYIEQKEITLEKQKVQTKKTS